MTYTHKDYGRSLSPRNELKLDNEYEMENISPRASIYFPTSRTNQLLFL